MHQNLTLVGISMGLFNVLLLWKLLNMTANDPSDSSRKSVPKIITRYTLPLHIPKKMLA